MGDQSTKNGKIGAEKDHYVAREKALLMEDKYKKEKLPSILIKTDSSSRQSWWARRTFLEKGLIILFFLMSFIAILVVVLLATSVHKEIANQNQVSHQAAEVCVTADCVKTASRVLDAMDTTVDPCDDFFQYACGSWNRKNVIPDDRSNYNTFGKLRDDINVALKTLLEQDVHASDSEVTTMVKHIYQACMNKSEIDRRGDQPLRWLIDVLGGWPVIDPDWDGTDFDWLEIVARLRLLNNRVLINHWVSADDKKSHENIIQLDQTNLGMPSRDYFLGNRDDRILRGYETFAVSVAMLLGATEEEAEKQIEEMIEFEIKIANITMPDSERRDTEALYHKFTISELYTNITKDIDWLRYLNTVFSNVSFTLDMDESIVMYTPRYFTQLAEIIKVTPARTLANYLVWRIVMNRVSNMPEAYTDRLHIYSTVLYGTVTERARWRDCVTYTNDNFGMAVGRLFVQKHFDEEAKATAEEMIQNIRDSFSELLDNVEWMEEETRARAREKADAMQEKIGYPDYILDDAELLKDYEGVDIHPDRYFQNVVNNLNFKTKNTMKKLREPVDKTEWSTTPAVVNAFYSAAKNQIMFPAGILQPPFYSETYPKSLNFGGIAMVIGHEMTHGFDDRGRQFDKDGNLLQWWSDSDIEKFKARAQCIIEQYNNYTIEEIGMHLNGKQTQGENIADNGGLKQSFKAYRNWVKKQGREEIPLPGLNLSHNQLFFLNFAQIWCGTARPENYLQSIRSGSHSPGKFRVIGVVSNSYDFAEAFQCPVGSKMNPTRKCEVW